MLEKAAFGKRRSQIWKRRSHIRKTPLKGYRLIFVWSMLVRPGLVARPRWPGPGGPVPVACFRARRPRFCRGPVAPVPVPAQVLAICPAGESGGPVPRPRPRSRPGPVPSGPGPNKADHLRSVASFKQSLPGIWWFYAVLQTTGERQTILRSRNHYRTKTGAKRLPKPTA